MAYCTNPHCPSPHNEENTQTCATCQHPLVLQKRYVALQPLVRGGFGRTFLAVDQSQSIKPRCVIKQHAPVQGSSHKAKELFQQEAARLEQLGTHNRIPALLASFEQAGFQYLVQEFIDGPDLAQHLNQQGPLDEEQIWQLLRALLPIVRFIHDNDVIHRDIKPANIIRQQSDQQLFLVDLGAAKHATGTALAMTGTVIGSAEYVAPEQARGKATFASDIYSLGVTCIHLLTGVSPFNLYDTANGQWVWRDFFPQSVSRELGTLLDGIIQVPTNQRYADCQTVEAVMGFAAEVSPDLVTDLRSKPEQPMQGYLYPEPPQDRTIPAPIHSPPLRPAPQPLPASFESGPLLVPLSDTVVPTNIEENIAATAETTQPANLGELDVEQFLNRRVPIRTLLTAGLLFLTSLCLIFGLYQQSSLKPAQNNAIPQPVLEPPLDPIDEEPPEPPEIPLMPDPEQAL